MKRTLKKLATLISTSLAFAAKSQAEPVEPPRVYDDDDLFVSVPLNGDIPLYLAAHRSHSSHGSHRSSSGGGHSSHLSHRSSASGGYRAPRQATPAPVYPSQPVTPPRRQADPSQPVAPPRRQADPLGQPARPQGSYPRVSPDQSLEEKLKDKETLRNIILRVQAVLWIEGYYEGALDGIMGPKTREGLRRFKQDHGLNENTLLDAPTLTALGILVH